MSEEKKPPENKPDAVEKKSPRDWAVELGHGPVANPKRQFTQGARRVMSTPRGSMAYEVAAVLHGWREHEHHAGEPMLLTRAEFEGALAAAMPEEGNPTPHAPALSETIPRHPKHRDHEKHFGKKGRAK